SGRRAEHFGGIVGNRREGRGGGCLDRGRRLPGLCGAGAFLASPAACGPPASRGSPASRAPPTAPAAPAIRSRREMASRDDASSPELERSESVIGHCRVERGKSRAGGL